MLYQLLQTISTFMWFWNQNIWINVQCSQPSRIKIGRSNLDFKIDEILQKTLNPWIKGHSYPPKHAKVNLDHFGGWLETSNYPPLCCSAANHLLKIFIPLLSNPIQSIKWIHFQPTGANLTSWILPPEVVVNDTQSDSIQYLNFAKKWFIQFLIQYCFTQDSIQNIIQFKKKSADSIQKIIQFNSQEIINSGWMG